MERERLGQAVARKVRAVQAEHGWRQDVLADHLASCGLSWDRNTVASFLNGRRELSAEEFVLLGFALEIPLAELAATDRLVLGEREFEGDAAGLLFGRDTGFSKIAAQVIGDGIDRKARQEVELQLGLLDEAMQRKLTRRSKMAALVKAVRQPADRELARRLGEAPGRVAAFAVFLWGHSLTEERDRRAGPDASVMDRSWATRRLEAELRAALDESGGPQWERETRKGGR